MIYSETFRTEKEMRDHTQPEDTLKDKEIKGSAGENLKCLFCPIFDTPVKITLL